MCLFRTNLYIRCGENKNKVRPSKAGGVRFVRSWLFAIPRRSKQIIIERPTGRGAILSLFPWDVGVLIDLWTIAIIEGLVVSYVFCG